MTTDLSGKRILVTGATGFIGGHLARKLHGEGADVLALERTPGKGDALARDGIAVVKGDITDRAQMATLFGSQNVQIVMHIAAWLGGRPFSNFRLVNVDATRLLAELSARYGIERFVFTSSIAVYGPHGDADVDETTPLKPYNSPYADTKIQAESTVQEIARSTNLPFVIVRPGMVYGPGSRGWTIRLAQWARSGKLPLIDGGHGTAYPVYIDNLVDLLVACATHPAAVGEIFNGVDDGPVTYAEFLGGYMAMIPTHRAIRLPGWIPKILTTLANPFYPETSLIYLADQLSGRGWVSNRKAKDRLGWTPHVSLKEGLANSEAWLREMGILDE
ncbi:MAG: NAD-dependent epimerase/dehydratase family protein [Anaerolineae bacterium]|nr:NAD-dependent epimerase/dehydratase family protein [Anaerolineae bacterium]